MQYTTLLPLLLLLAASSSATAHLPPLLKRQTPSSSTSDDDDDSSIVSDLPCDPNSNSCQYAESLYLKSICYPANSTQQPDLSAPCWQNYAIVFECGFGASAGLEIAWGNIADGTYGVPENATMLSNETQRNCICQSQFFATFTGCSDCYTKHGGSSSSDYASGAVLAPSLVSSFSSSYCAVTNTPTANFGDVLFGLPTQVSTSGTEMQTSTFSDPLANETAVEPYWTPGVTGSAAWGVVAQATGTGSDGSVVDVRTSGGQIVATEAGAVGSSTAVASATGSDGSASRASGSSTSTSTSTSHAGGAQQTAAVAGVIALAGIVAML